MALVGHSVLRHDAMDRLDRPATEAEIETMRTLMAEAMEAGAIGMSSGLFYPPARAARTEEVAAIAEMLTEGDGIYTAHIRDEGDHVLEAIEEAAAIARHADIQVIISPPQMHRCRQPRAQRRDPGADRAIARRAALGAGSLSLYRRLFRAVAGIGRARGPPR